jgi:hypothetical protein
MSVPYRQRRLLRRIDHSLRRSDPDLQSMLLIFARLNAGEEMPAWEQLPGAESAAWHMVWPIELTPHAGPFFLLPMEEARSVALAAMHPPRAPLPRRPAGVS